MIYILETESVDLLEKESNTLRKDIENVHKDFTEGEKSKNIIVQDIQEISDDLDIEFGVKSGCGATRAWTHYSVYRSKIFNNGVVFDETGPFSGPGYGFDDDDLGMQIIEAGYQIVCFKNLYCF